MCINSTYITQVLWIINLIVVKEKVKNYTWLMVIQLELCIILIVQLLHIITTGFWFDIKAKERKKGKYTITATLTKTKKDLEIVLILISYYAIVINGKIKKYNLLIVIKLALYEIVLHKHDKQLDLLIFKVIINYTLKVLKENSIAQSRHVVTTKFHWGFLISKRKTKKKDKNMKRIHYCIFLNEL